MNRLQLEWQRLYAPAPLADQPAPGAAAKAGAPDDQPKQAAPTPAAGQSPLVDGAGQVRAMVLELARPASWPALAPLWQGVQTDLGLPAPAIAVSGQDGIQLWFSLAAPLPAPQAMAFLAAVQQRYLADVPAHRLALRPALNTTAPGQLQHAAPVPAQQPGAERWSAFVAPDLAAMFADEPWLDMAPNPDGQAKLLAGLACIPLADLARASAQLQAEVAARAAPALPPAACPSPTVPPAMPPERLPAQSPTPGPAGTLMGPQRFLLEVLNNEAAPLALRIDAAKALLPYMQTPTQA